MATRIQLPSTSATSDLVLQEERLREDLASMKEHLAGLQAVQTELAYQAGALNQATLEAQTVLSMNPLAAIRVQPNQAHDPLGQMLRLYEVVQLLQNGQANQQSEEEMAKLNIEIGKTNALADSLIEKANQTDQLTIQMRALIEKRKQTISLQKKISQDTKI